MPSSHKCSLHALMQIRAAILTADNCRSYDALQHTPFPCWPMPLQLFHLHSITFMYSHYHYIQLPPHTTTYQKHHQCKLQSQDRCIGVGCSNQMQLAQEHHLSVILALVPPAFGCCIPCTPILVPNIVLTLCNLRWCMMFFLPTTSTNTQLVLMVVITRCNLCCWCFSFRHYSHNVCLFICVHIY